jgi:hypothetical protein
MAGAETLRRCQELGEGATVHTAATVLLVEDW